MEINNTHKKIDISIIKVEMNEIQSITQNTIIRDSQIKIQKKCIHQREIQGKKTLL